jgi:hypothetical protein
MPHMNVTFEWRDPNRIVTELKRALEAKGKGLRSVPERAIVRGTALLLSLVQKHAPKKTSTLARSLTMVVERISADMIQGRVGTPLHYGRYLEEGTGIYGPRHQQIVITAKGKALFWGAHDANGDPLFRKRVIIKGIQPRGYFAAAIGEFLPRYVEIVMQELAKEAAA